MNKTEHRLLQSAAKHEAGLVNIDRHAYNGREHRAAAYLQAENYGVYFADACIPHFKLWPYVKRALLKQQS